VKTIEQYAAELVADGAESHAEDDLNEDGEVNEPDHLAACALALDIVRAIRARPDELIAWARGEHKVLEALGGPNLTVEQEIRADALTAAAWLLGPCVGEVLGGGHLRDLAAVSDEWLTLAAVGARYIETGKFAADLAATGATEGEATGQLWAVHVIGPDDDIIAMPDRATADAKAAEVNRVSQMLRERADASPLDAHISAEVVLWIGTKEEHAEAVAAFASYGEYVP
jgi:hypothetical protein